MVQIEYSEKWKEIYKESENDFDDYDEWIKSMMYEYRNNNGLSKGEMIDLDDFTSFLEKDIEN